MKSKVKALCLMFALVVCLGLLSSCGSKSVVGKYSGADCVLTLQEDNTCSFKTIIYTYKGTYTVEDDTVIMEYKGTDPDDWSKTRTFRMSFTRDGEDFRYNGYSGSTILLTKRKK